MEGRRGTICRMGVSSPNRSGSASKLHGRATLHYAGPARERPAAPRGKVLHLVLGSLGFSTLASMGLLYGLMASGIRYQPLEDAVMPVLSISLFVSVLGMLISQLFFREGNE